MAIFLAVSFAFAQAPSGDDLVYSRRKLDVYRNHPAELARIRQEADRFDDLPVERQVQLRQLDRELHELPSAVQARLEDTLDRYVEWLDKLDLKDRERIQKAPDAKARIAVIRELRQAEWLARQPKALRDAVAAVAPAKRAELVERERREDQKRQAQWALAHCFKKELVENRPLPTKPEELDFQARAYLNEILSRLLTKEELERLKKAEGQWPLYPRTLVELADKHPPALPSETAPRSYAELPKIVQGAFGKKGPLKATVIEKRLKPFEGRYPEFAVQITKYAAENNVILPAEWWPATLKGLATPMQEFVERKLTPILDPKERRELIEAETKWPEYPLAIKKLSEAHDLVPPWHVLPASERWDAYRPGKSPTVAGYPELPKYKLRDFVAIDLDDTDRHEIKNKIEGNQAREGSSPWSFLVEPYFQRYPSELARLRAADRQRAK